MPHALIVEDDPNSLSGLSAILSADGFSVDTATTLAEARAALTRFIPDVVLVDLNLPDGSGLDLFRRIRAAGSTVDVMIVSSARDADIVRTRSGSCERRASVSCVLRFVLRYCGFTCRSLFTDCTPDTPRVTATAF